MKNIHVTGLWVKKLEERDQNFLQRNVHVALKWQHRSIRFRS